LFSRAATFIEDSSLIFLPFERWDFPLQFWRSTKYFVKCCRAQQISVIASVSYFKDPIVTSFLIVLKFLLDLSYSKCFIWYSQIWIRA